MAEDLDPQLVREARACITINVTAPYALTTHLRDPPLEGVVPENAATSLFIRMLNAFCDKSLVCIPPEKGYAPLFMEKELKSGTTPPSIVCADTSN